MAALNQNLKEVVCGRPNKSVLESRLIVILILLLHLTSVQGQSLEWAATMGGFEYDDVTSVEVDDNGNVYTTGSFHGTVDFAPGPEIFNLTAVGDGDVFVQKLDPSGNLLWARSFGGGLSDFGVSIWVDSEENVYTAGRFYSTVDFDPGSGTLYLTGSGEGDAFVQKLDSNGNLLWAQKIGGEFYDWAGSIRTNGSGDVFVAGAFSGTVDFDSGPGTSSINSGTEGQQFLLKLDSSGNFVWVRSFAKHSGVALRSMTMDASGNFLFTGQFREQVDFDPGPDQYSLTADFLGDIFVLKLDSMGNFLWANSCIGLGFRQSGYSIVADQSNNVYCGGLIRGTVDFDPGAGVSDYTSVGHRDGFVLKLDSGGNFQWVSTIGDIHDDFVKSVDIGIDGNVYFTGWFGGTIDFDPGPGIHNLTALVLDDVFVSKLDYAGKFQWAVSMSGEMQEWGHSLTVDQEDNVIVVGEYSGPTDFDPGEEALYFTPVGLKDIFVLKLNPPITYIQNQESVSSIISLYPNPTSRELNVDLGKTHENVMIEVFDLIGTKVMSKPSVSGQLFNFEMPEQPGLYLVRISTDDGVLDDSRIIKME